MLSYMASAITNSSTFFHLSHQIDMRPVTNFARQRFNTQLFSTLPSNYYLGLNAMDRNGMTDLGMVIFIVTFITLCYVTYAWLVPPRSFPRNIPTIPFYVSLIPLFKDVDQEDVYRKYFEEPLQKYGAVKVFFGSRWNILVQRPSFVAEVFKYEDIYAKSGNQKKIPYSVLAEYTGDNIISSHGENWRLYQKVIKPGLQQEFNSTPILKNARNLVDMLFQEQENSKNGSVLVPQLFQRYTLANLSEGLLDSSFEV